MDLISKIMYLMKKNNIKNTAQLSRETNIPYTTLKSIFDGDVNDIRLSTSRKLCDFFKITLDELLDDSISLDNNFTYASHNGINVEGLDEKDLKEIQEYVDFKRNQKRRIKKMDLNSLYQVIDNENIDVDNIKWTNSKARIFQIDNQYSIAVDYSKIDNSVEEKEIIAEELGHYYCNALYYLNSDKTLKDKCEYRAMKWAYSVLVPFQKLKEKIAQGLDLYDLAEYFDVDCKYMIDCINFYTEKYGILV